MGNPEGPSAHVDRYEDQDEGNGRDPHTVPVVARKVETRRYRHMVADEEDQKFVRYLHVVLSARFERTNVIVVDTCVLRDEDEQDRLNPRLVVNVHCDQDQHYSANDVHQVVATWRKSAFEANE